MMELIRTYDSKAIYKSTNKYYNGYLHFTITRDDNERLFSTWREKIQRKNYDEAMKFIKKHPGLYWKMPYKEFVEYTVCNPDPHWEPCETFLNVNKLDLVIPYEVIKRWSLLPTRNTSREKSWI